MKTCRLGFVLFVGLVLLVGQAGPALAQGQVEITAPPPLPPPRPEIITPGQPVGISRPREQDFYPDEIRLRHDPAFIAPLSATVPTGPKTVARFGLSGWTAPRGRGGDSVAAREVPGWLAFGFSFVWDIPIEPEPAESSR